MKKFLAKKKKRKKKKNKCCNVVTKCCNSSSLLLPTTATTTMIQSNDNNYNNCNLISNYYSMKRCNTLFVHLTFFLLTLLVCCKLKSGGELMPSCFALKLTANSKQPANNEQPFASITQSVVVGESAQLACDISPPANDDAVALVLWYKDDALAPIYTIDARKAQSFDKAMINVDAAFAARATFNARAKPAHMQIKRVRESDAGEFRCRVDFKKGRTVNTIISLSVIELPSEVQIFEHNKLDTQVTGDGLIGPFDEGAELRLVCVAFGGKPRPSVVWLRDHNVIDESFAHVDKQAVSNELLVDALTRNHVLSQLTCQASNTNLTKPVQKSVKFDLNLRPSNALVRPIARPLVAGVEATFECASHGSKPHATIHWLFDNSRLDTPLSFDKHKTVSRLTMKMERAFNGRPLTCVAENQKIANSQVSSTLNLDVQFAPTLNISVDGDERKIQEGDDVYLSCKLDANPAPSKQLVWRHNGRVLQPTSNVVLVNNESLVLRGVDRSQSGKFECEASNALGTTTSTPIELSVQFAPTCEHGDQILIYEPFIGQSVDIECSVLSSPQSSLKFAWFKSRNSTLVNLSDTSRDTQLDESTKKLRVKLKSSDDYSLFKCRAKNSIGLQQQPCALLLRPPPISLPQIQHSCSILNSTAASLRVKCLPPSNDSNASRQRSKTFADNNNNSDDSDDDDGDDGGSIEKSASLFAAWPAVESLRQLANATQNKVRKQRVVYPPSWLLAQVRLLSATTNESIVVVVARSEHLSSVKATIDELRASNSQLVRNLPSSSSIQFIAVKVDDEQQQQQQQNNTNSKLQSSKFEFLVQNLRQNSSYELKLVNFNTFNVSLPTATTTTNANANATSTDSIDNSLVLVGRTLEATDGAQVARSSHQKSLVVRSELGQLNDDNDNNKHAEFVDADSTANAALTTTKTTTTTIATTNDASQLFNNDDENSLSKLRNKLTAQSVSSFVGERVEFARKFGESATRFARTQPLKASALVAAVAIVVVVALIGACAPRKQRSLNSATTLQQQQQQHSKGSNNNRNSKRNKNSNNNNSAVDSDDNSNRSSDSNIGDDEDDGNELDNNDVSGDQRQQRQAASALFAIDGATTSFNASKKALEVESQLQLLNAQNCQLIADNESSLINNCLPTATHLCAELQLTPSALVESFISSNNNIDSNINANGEHQEHAFINAPIYQPLTVRIASQQDLMASQLIAQRQCPAFASLERGARSLNVQQQYLHNEHQQQHQQQQHAMFMLPASMQTLESRGRNTARVAFSLEPATSKHSSSTAMRPAKRNRIAQQQQHQQQHSILTNSNNHQHYLERQQQQQQQHYQASNYAHYANLVQQTAGGTLKQQQQRNAATDESSANTNGDSGHESPQTGDTNSSSVLFGNAQLLQAQNSSSQLSSNSNLLLLMNVASSSSSPQSCAHNSNCENSTPTLQSTLNDEILVQQQRQEQQQQLEQQQQQVDSRLWL